MKSTVGILLLTALAYTQAKPNFAKLTTPPAKADSVLVPGYIDVPAQIPVRIKVPAGKVLRAGQRLLCRPTTASPVSR